MEVALNVLVPSFHSFLTSRSALLLTSRILSLSILIQTLELIALRSVMSPQGVWRWSDLKEDFESANTLTRKVLGLLCDYPNFLIVLLLRLTAALFLLISIHPFILLILLLTTTLILVRWRGSFNGGSDYMTLVVISALLISQLFPGRGSFAIGALWYITFQVCASFFKAGFYKILRPNWRQGLALRGFLISSIYRESWFVQFFCQSPRLLFMASWIVILLECSFPLALIHPGWCATYIGMAIAFQIGNIYFFGLNRFLFAWLAAYPALFYCSGRLF